jgi:DNA-binding beta-propeller fold protein YncE
VRFSSPDVIRAVRSAAASAALVALVSTTVAALPAGAPGASAVSTDRSPHEVWAMDQGTDLIHVLDEHGREISRIDVSPSALSGFPALAGRERTVPHMIQFDSRHRFAFVAATAGASTLVIDAHRKEVVEVLPTGPGSHMAVVTPDDRSAWVAVIGTAELVEIELTLDGGGARFAIGERLPVSDLLAPIEQAAGWTFPSYSPVCLQYTPDGAEAWVTLGPGPRQGGLFVFDLATRTVSHAWDPDDVRANCGVGIRGDGRRAVANWSGDVGPGNDSDGEWYVFDTATKDLVHRDSARGFDAHGVRFSPNGRDLWAVNRISDNALIIDARTFRVRRDVQGIAATPDILDFSPDGRTVYITQRGPSPRSGGTHAASGPQPGVAIVHAASARQQRAWEPPTVTGPDGTVLNDLHGVDVRPVSRSEVADRELLPLPRTRVSSRPGATGQLFHCGIQPGD